MKKLVYLFVSLVTLPSFAQETTTKQVIEKYMTAIGGKQAASEIEDLTMKMTAEIQGQKMETLVQKKQPNKFLTVVTIDGMGEMNRIVCDGKKAKMTAMGQTQDLEGEALEALLKQNSFFGEMSYLEDDSKVTYEGIEKVNDTDCHKLKVTTTMGDAFEYYDAATGLKVRQVMDSKTPMGEMTITTDISDYRQVGGVKFPHKLKQDMGMMAFEMVIEELKVNQGLSDLLFTIE